ncbi:hypothetical protein ACQKDS_01990 [Serratia sp. NPDC078593]|uniref:hypothetical protein n=1 Tax=unclassified Serratia (in: enterobacteria) TaxID=2647522 RepID=UPI0037D638CD
MTIIILTGFHCKLVVSAPVLKICNNIMTITGDANGGRMSTQTFYQNGRNTGVFALGETSQYYSSSPISGLVTCKDCSGNKMRMLASAAFARGHLLPNSTANPKGQPYRSVVYSENIQFGQIKPNGVVVQPGINNILQWDNVVVEHCSKPTPVPAKCSINAQGWQDLGRYSNESIKKGAFVRIQSTIECDQDTTVSLKAVNPIDQTSFVDFKNGVRGAVNVGVAPGADGVALQVHGNQPLDPKVSVTLFGQGDITPGRHDTFIVLQATIL